MPLPPPADWTLDDARKAVHLDALERARIAVPRLMALHDRTFDQSLTGENRAAVQEALENGYRTISRRAQRIADQIGSVLKSTHLDGGR